MWDWEQEWGPPVHLGQRCPQTVLAVLGRRSAASAASAGPLDGPLGHWDWNGDGGTTHKDNGDATRSAACDRRVKRSRHAARSWTYRFMLAVWRCGKCAETLLALLAD